MPGTVLGARDRGQRLVRCPQGAHWLVALAQRQNRESPGAQRWSPRPNLGGPEGYYNWE